MNNYKKLFLHFLVMTGLLIGSAAAAQAQATRTWISGVGDDANPCSRTAPCKTFQGTISKTATAGEINVLDPGGFGGVTITKSITIDTHDIAGVLVSGTNGIIINDTSGSGTAVITLRGLDINGLGTGLSGVKIINAKTVNVQHCDIYGFTLGISDERTVGGNLNVSDSTIRNNTTANVNIVTAGSPANYATLDNVKLLSSGSVGLAVRGGNSAVIRRSLIADNGSLGIAVNDAGSSVAVEECTIAYNGTGIGIKTSNPIVRISSTMVTKNDTGLSAGTGGGQIISFGNNRVSGNTNENNPTSTIGQL